MTPSKRTWTVSDVVYSIGFIYLHILMQKVIFRRSFCMSWKAPLLYDDETSGDIGCSEKIKSTQCKLGGLFLKYTK